MNRAHIIFIENLFFAFLADWMIHDDGYGGRALIRPRFVAGPDVIFQRDTDIHPARQESAGF
ncbi:MAG TPA: hypothetical protein PK878_10325 [bacterium]|nr:hypothetical protein [Candidatus Omnitrophota bacterium]HOJ60670.1 hypothetical protein [bacterium]HOL94356.1 hypothetical protein [bacterium]HPP00722.1 hypothetical protein [bacterium]